MNLKLPQWLISVIDWITDTFNFTVASILSLSSGILQDLVPVKNAIHLLLLFFFLDVIIGIWKAKKIDKIRFNPKIIWDKTVPRVVLSVILIVSLFMWDTVYKQEYISSYNIGGWFISGLLLASIMKNMYFLTKWEVFKIFGHFIEEKIEDKGLKSDDEDDK